MDRGAWQAAVHGVTKSWTQLSAKLVMVAVTGEGGWGCGAMLCTVIVPQVKEGGREGGRERKILCLNNDTVLVNWFVCIFWTL